MRVVNFSLPIEHASVVVQQNRIHYFHDYFHKHNETQITLIVNGSGTLTVNNYNQKFGTGDVYIIKANEPHIFNPDQSGISQAIHIFFDQQKVSNLIQFPELDEIRDFFKTTCHSIQLQNDGEDYAQSQIKAISSSTGLKRLFSLIELLHFFASEMRLRKSLSTGFIEEKLIENSAGDRMNAIYNYAKQNYMEEIPLEKIAAVANLTPHAFCKYFKKNTMKTWGRFLNETRINEACRVIIKTSGDSIAAVAYANGFNSLITFNRVFKKITGMCPTSYLRKFKSQDLYSLNT